MRRLKQLLNKVNLPNGFVVFALLAGLLGSIGFALEKPLVFLNLPALMIVFLGTILATALSFSYTELKVAYRRVRELAPVTEADLTGDANQILHFSQLWFRKLYHLIDRDIEALDNLFLKKGLQMIRDRQSGEDIKALMNWKLAQEKDRDMRSIKIFQTMASYAPVFGLIGSVVGIMIMLNGFDIKQGFESLASGIAVAFVSTLYGLLLSQLVVKPLVIKLEGARNQRLKHLAMLAEGVVMIEQGRSPAQVRDILLDYIQSAESDLDVYSKSKSADKGKAARKPFLLKFGA